MSATQSDRDSVDYSIRKVSDLLTPALAIYPDFVEHNITTTLALLGNDPARWRPHVKTAKLSSVMRLLANHGVTAIKCATTLELLTACRAGATDVLFAMAVSGANARRIVEIAREFPAVAISVLVEVEAQLSQWQNTPIGVFLDINPGMDRTGIAQEDTAGVVKLAELISQNGLPFRGLHYYDGHVSDANMELRTKKAHAGYDRLLQLVEGLQKQGITPGEVITSGTPTLPCALSYPGLNHTAFVHRVSPGTVVYGDLTSQSQLPSLGYKLAALVVSRVVSHPSTQIATCDAGHKAVSADAGVPNCAVMGWENLTPARPSEEHLPITVASGETLPGIGEILYLVPKHVCPTVNNFSHALLVRQGEIVATETVDARGREAPLTSKSSM